MKKNLCLQSFVSVLVAAVYIVLVAFLMINGEALFGSDTPQPSVLVPIFMLMLFVLSVAIMGVLFLAKPVMLYLDGKKKEAVKLLTLNIGWAFIFTIVALVLNIIM